MRDLDRIEELERSGKLVVTKRRYYVRLTNPQTRQAVGFYPARGIIIRGNARQIPRGLDAALKLIGVRVAA